MENQLILTPAEEPQIERLRPIYSDQTSKDSGVYSAVSDFMSKKKGMGPKKSMDPQNKSSRRKSYQDKRRESKKQ
jgi:hypothetical protein